MTRNSCDGFGGAKRVPTYDVLGIAVAPLNRKTITEMLFCSGGVSGPRIFANVNLHALYLRDQDDSMRRLFESAHVIHIDGMPVVWIAKLLGHPFRAEHRVTYVDWQPEILRAADERGASIFFVGGAPGVGDKAEMLIRSRFPGIRFGHHHGFFLEGAGSESVLKAIRKFAPDILFVGMGMPRQEEWILRNKASLPPCAVLPCGASFDYYTGMVPTPPRFLGRLGLEWFFRLVMEPRRLWRRYVLEPFALAPRIIAQLRS